MNFWRFLFRCFAVISKIYTTFFLPETSFASAFFFKKPKKFVWEHVVFSLGNMFTETAPPNEAPENVFSWSTPPSVLEIIAEVHLGTHLFQAINILYCCVVSANVIIVVSATVPQNAE